MKYLSLILSLLLAGCATHMERISRDEGALLVSIRQTKNAFSAVSNRENGYYFFLGKPPNDSALTGYFLWNGRFKDAFGSGGADAVELIDDFEPFDYKAEVNEVTKRMKWGAAPMAFDGAEFEIKIFAPKGTFVLREWNPDVAIDACAPYSPKIARLRAIIHALQRFYGQSKIGV